ncbi:hypothetical protein VKT23_020054 [Stygiomarasmius scandens]|uniref:CCHC-type domain-containing protein n=1 Tax=Marasmiellus scandens TaxID=2682957 RepID=A0ABR1ILW9_9AGAR
MSSTPQPASSSSEEVYNSLAPLINDVLHRVAQAEAEIARVRQENINPERMYAAFTDAISNATFNLSSSSTESSGRPSTLRVDLPYFRGNYSESIRAWISIVQDHLIATKVPKENWGVAVSGLFRDSAQTWYLAKKQERNDEPLSWDELVTELKASFDAPTRVDDLRRSLHSCRYRGNISEFIGRFQRVEMQVATSTEMTFGDKKYIFTHALPPDVSFHVNHSDPKSMKEVYEAARTYERYKRSSQPNHHNDRRIERQLASASAIPPSSFPSTSGTSTSASMAPVPMDLDTFTSRPRPVNTPFQRQGSPMPKRDLSNTRCFNCNRTGHLAKTCKMPDRRRPFQRQPTPRPPTQPLFWIGDPDPLRPAHNRVRPYPTYTPTLLDRLSDKIQDDKKVSEAEVEEFLCSLPKDCSDPRLDLHNLDLEDQDSKSLPVYAARIGGRRSRFSRRRNTIEVETIVDTGATDNYIRRDVAERASAEFYKLHEPREVAGAGHTITREFAKFHIEVGCVKEIMLAYVLESDSGFRYDLLTGRHFAKVHNITFNWDDNSFDITSPKSHLTVRVRALRYPAQFYTYIPPWETDDIASPFSDSDSMPSLEPLSESDNDSAIANENMLNTAASTSAQHTTSADKKSKWSSFGQALKEKAKKLFPKLFRDKVGYPPLRRWVHDIDTGDAQPVCTAGRPLSPAELVAVKEFIEEGKREGVIEDSNSPWSSSLLLVPKKDECLPLASDR